MTALRLITQRPVYFRASVWPFELRTGVTVLGSPEHVLIQMLHTDFNTFFGHRWHPGVGTIRALAKRPDSQAAAEKAAIMSIGALLGTRSIGDAGTLGLDEIFSPEQLPIDCGTATG